MTWTNGIATLHHADARDIPILADQSVHCVVTSPPYWGLRSYGLGDWDRRRSLRELARLAEHLDNIVAVTVVRFWPNNTCAMR